MIPGSGCRHSRGIRNKFRAVNQNLAPSPLRWSGRGFSLCFRLAEKWRSVSRPQSVAAAIRSGPMDRASLSWYLLLNRFHADRSMLRHLLTASTPISRRTFVQAGGLSAVGLSLPQLMASRRAEAGPATTALPPAGSAKACILLYMLGGPPQQETFDMKPEAPGTRPQPVQADRHECAGDRDLRTASRSGAPGRSVRHRAIGLSRRQRAVSRRRACITTSPAGRIFRARENRFSIGATIPAIGAVLNQLREHA